MGEPVRRAHERVRVRVLLDQRGQTKAQALGLYGDGLHLALHRSVFLSPDGQACHHPGKCRGECASMRSHRSAAGHRRARRDRRHELRDSPSSAHRLAHLVLKHHVAGEPTKLNVMRGSLEERSLGNQPDDLTPRGRHAAPLGFTLHGLVGAPDGCRVGVGQVH